MCPCVGHLFICALWNQFWCCAESSTSILNLYYFYLSCLYGGTHVGMICRHGKKKIWFRKMSQIQDWILSQSKQWWLEAPSNFLTSENLRKMVLFYSYLHRGLLVIPFCILSNLFCHCSEASADSAESFFKLFFFPFSMDLLFSACSENSLNNMYS